MDIAAQKNQVRAEVLTRRDGSSESERASASSKITERLLAHPALLTARTVASYVSFRTEFDTTAFNRALLTSGKRLLLPRMVRNPNDLRFHEVSDFSAMLPGKWGILEPDAARCVEVETNLIDWILVPGVAFDRRGNRLGYGGGFYDRVLARLTSSAARIAAAFSFQVIDRVPIDATDQTVDCVVTEIEIISIHSTSSGA